jgi:uncharacterized protein (DUF1499 family)
MDWQKSFFCIMAGQEARTKAMKIAVSVPGNNICYTSFWYLYQQLLYAVYSFNTEISFPFAEGLTLICRGGSSIFKRARP